MNRRLFLQGIGSVSLAGLLSSCGSIKTDHLDVHILRRSLPIQLFRAVRNSLDPSLQIKIGTHETVPELFGQLQSWQQESASSNLNVLRLAGLGDYWLSQAIQQGLIRPLPLSSQDLMPLAPELRSLVTRDAQGQVSAGGNIWGAPYRWGATVLVYRKDKLDQFSWQPTDWADLWRPELKGRVGLLDQPREVIGMTLKQLGHSYNDPQPQNRPEVKTQLNTLHEQTRFYSSNHYLQALMLGDTWVSMGWSSDILPALKQDDKLGVVFPESGSSKWADLWVKSAVQEVDDDFPADQLMSQWVKYWWREDVTKDITQVTEASSVIQPPTLEEAKNISQQLLSQENFDRSEFLLPLTVKESQNYKQLWLEMRQG